MTPKFEFICGSAGVGKTWLAKDRLNSSNGSTVLAATTGIAAVNLGDATTINSLLWYYNTQGLMENWVSGKLDKALKRISEEQGIREIIIDEVSMLSGDQLDIITRGVDFHNTHSKHPLSITLVGDFAQLPPVKEKFAFEAQEWPRYEANTTKLTEIRRQSDKDFIEALLAARIGDGERASQFFSHFFQPTVDLKYDGTTIMAKNEEVDRFNQIRMDELTTPIVKFFNSREGKESTEWKNIPRELVVKPGALVMVLVNKHFKLTDGLSEIVYVNGDLGHFVRKLDDETAEIRLIRDNSLHEIEMITRKNEIIENKRRKEIGSIRYMPLRVAYASTVHKAQGLTMDRVQVNIRNPFFMAPGMIYVALSRARSIEGLRLVGNKNLLVSRCNVDPRIKRWL